jgi:hypothetical protein
MELEDIILREVNQIQKTKGFMFFSLMWIQAQYKYKQYYMYIEIFSKHVSNSVTGRGDQGRRKRKKDSE